MWLQIIRYFEKILYGFVFVHTFSNGVAVVSQLYAISLVTALFELNTALHVCVLINFKSRVLSNNSYNSKKAGLLFDLLQ